MAARQRVPDEFEVKRSRIVEAAVNAFTKMGLAGANNKAIAKEAGVSPGLIYWYFKDKEELFRAVLERFSPAVEIEKRLHAAVDEPPEDLLREVALSLLQHFDQPHTRQGFKLVLAGTVHRPAVGQAVFKEVTRLLHSALAEYLERGMAAGRFIKVDPWLAAQTFLGSLISFVLVREVFEVERYRAYSNGEIAGTVTQTFLQGIVAREREEE